MASIALLQFSPNRFKDRRLATSHAGKPRCRRSASNSLEVSFWEINPLSGRITAKSEIEIRPDPSEFTRPPCRLAPSAAFLIIGAALRSFGIGSSCVFLTLRNCTDRVYQLL